MTDDGLTFLFEQGDELLLLLNQPINLCRLVVEELGDLSLIFGDGHGDRNLLEFFSCKVRDCGFVANHIYVALLLQREQPIIQKSIAISSNGANAIYRVLEVTVGKLLVPLATSANVPSFAHEQITFFEL